MAFCANCGAALNEGSGFCGNCGKAVGTANQAAAAPPAAGATASASTGLSTNVAGALAYVLGLITGIVFLVIEPYKNDRFVRFHAMQSIFFSLFCIAFSIAWSIVWGILLSISWAFFWIDMPLRMVIFLGFFVLWLYLMYQAYQQREYRIPWIGDLAAKQVH